VSASRCGLRRSRFTRRQPKAFFTDDPAAGEGSARCRRCKARRGNA
jgi:hypothetical protein